jgi:uncharacterized protein YkwD
MKRNIFLSAFAALLPFIFVISHSFADKNDFRNDSYYDAFTPEAFKHYGQANRVLDFEEIDYPLLRAAIFFEINGVRAAYGKSPLLHSKALENVAISHARDMVERGFFSHVNPYDSERRTSSQRMDAFGATGKFRAENIALAFGIRYKEGSPVIPPPHGEEPFRDLRTGKVIRHHTYNSFAEAVVEGWMHSPGHKANILDKRLKFLGAGACHFEDRNFYNMHTFKVTVDMSSHVPD